jgi:hypothetical protein
LLIYTTHITSRLQYIVETLFAACRIDNYKIETDKNDLINYANCKINYSAERICNDEIWIKPHELLFEKNIQTQKIECFDWNGLKIFFKTEGDIPFDIFAASLYLISRYEEYLPHEKDMYGRYAHINSIAFKENFLQIPLVNLWMKEFSKLLQAHDSRLTIQASAFKFIPTYDIDIADNYLHHSLKHNVGNAFKAIVNRQSSAVNEIINVLWKRKPDPFDIYNWLDRLHEKYNLSPAYFFLLAEKRRKYDKNISPESEAMKKIIQRHAEKYDVGIHPSWQSGDDEKILKNEIETLKKITGKEVFQSRQHYIKMQFPETYQLSVKNKISEDYSMGYASINGFRASFASSFFWYDLGKEEKTNLKIHPFCFMEANSFFEQHYSAQQAAEELQEYHDAVKSVNGTLITIFHNHFLTQQKEWIEWRKMYENFLKKFALLQ